MGPGGPTGLQNSTPAVRRNESENGNLALTSRFYSVNLLFSLHSDSFPFCSFLLITQLLLSNRCQTAGRFSEPKSTAKARLNPLKVPRGERPPDTLYVTTKEKVKA